MSNAINQLVSQVSWAQNYASEIASAPALPQDGETISWQIPTQYGTLRVRTSCVPHKIHLQHVVTHNVNSLGNDMQAVEAQIRDYWRWALLDKYVDRGYNDDWHNFTYSARKAQKLLSTKRG